MAISLDRVRRGFYMDSAALMRLAQTLSARPGVEQAAMMIGSHSNKRLMEEAGLLGASGRLAGANDLVVAVRAESEAAAVAALAEAEALLDRPNANPASAGEYRPRSLDTACTMLPGANLALISVPGEFAAAEAMKALRRDLHVMVFSDNVPIAAEVALKEEATRRGLLMMGPDCGTAIIAGAPIGFANVVPRGTIGIVSASGTGLQEVACLIAHAGEGISHAIGVGGRDLSPAVGGLTTLAAIAALDDDAATRRIVLISKPPEPEVARRILDRVAQSDKDFVICFLGIDHLALPPNAQPAATLREAAVAAVGGHRAAGSSGLADQARAAAAQLGPGRRWIRGLFSGGTLCAEAQVVLKAAGERSCSNAPIPGVAPLQATSVAGHSLIDLGADAYTVGRPHPMIEPAVRTPHLAAALADCAAAVVLVDVVLGYGGHPDPASAVAAVVERAPTNRPLVIASVTGTAEDPQGYDEQAAILRRAGIFVAASNADAAELAVVRPA
jgi:FdrA protein